jgi:hypothetical protein
MDDLILSVVKDRQWSDIDCYALSLVQTGYKGRAIMFVDNVPVDAQKNLLHLGIEVIPFTFFDPPNTHFQTSRYRIAERFLEKHAYEFKNILWTDVCDLIFQTDPMLWQEQCGYYTPLIGAKEGWKIKDQAINDIWLQRLTSGPEYHNVREREVLCSGTIMGTPPVMTELFYQIAACNDGMQGIDQGMWNLLSRRHPLSGYLRVPEMNEGFVSTCGIFLAKSDPAVWTIEPPIFDRDTGLVMTPDGSKPFAIQHQYNRSGGQFDPDGSWRQIVERRYRR